MDEAVHESFERWASATPDAIAVRYRDQSLSYAELNRRANQLAHRLGARGIGAEHRVIVCLEPSLDIAVALLGILKAGAVYVPLDPTYPAPRIEAILGDTQPSLVLSRRDVIARLGLAGRECLAVDAAEVVEEARGENAGIRLEADRTAYVYYTSGTTGAPKGIMASQGNLTVYLKSARERYGFTDRDVLPAVARFGFSISMFELLSPLTAGGTLLVLDREHIMDLEKMAHTLGEVTCLHAGPALMTRLLGHIERQPDAAVFPRMRHASMGGDTVRPELLERVKRVFAGAEVFVIYGCSEVSCMGCTWPVPRDRLVARTFVGRSFDHMTVRVLDEALRPVPRGTVGEVLFAGSGLVKGYLNRPELTGERFVQLDGQRFYRTGDLGRMSDDGSVELVGRNDFQVKVRGVRIELGEVEHHLRAAPRVREAVVAGKPTPTGEKRLVAYVVLDDAQADRRSAMAEIRRYLVAHLPDYMIPAAFVALAALPLNFNMKLDRNALPEPEGDPRVRPPETKTEELLAELWAKILRVEQVGLDDHFFELGGDSLSAMELIVAIERALHITVDGMDVLREPLEVFAQICDRRLGREPKRTSARSAPESDEVATGIHFGPDASLRGVRHAPRGARKKWAVLICPPVGQERARTHFVVTRLARQLAARGAPTLHFDFSGCGESLGESRDASLDRWQRDVAAAHRELRAHAPDAQIVALGIRLGGSMLYRAWEKEGLDLARLILWDPVVDGAAHHAELARMHRDYVRSMRHLRLWRFPRRARELEELGGATYSLAMIDELERLRIAPPAERWSQMRWLVTSGDLRRQLPMRLVDSETEETVTKLDLDCGWQDAARVEEILPDGGVVGTLTRLLSVADERPPETPMVADDGLRRVAQGGA
jgi:amino acid adenylation domain-containing protein